MNHKPSPSEYLIISRGKWDKSESPQEIQKTIDRFYGWLQGLVDEGKMKRGQRLTNKGKTVSMKSVTDGPFGESKEVIGGYWTIVADSLEEASKMLAESPCLKCGLFYEIRPIEREMCSAFDETCETPE